MDTKKTHHVIDIPKPGGLEALVWTEQPIPQPAHGEVLVRVHAAGVNAADHKQREGVYDMPAKAGTVPGLEIAGEIAACGTGTSRFKPGDRVCALVIDGGYAEYCVVPEVQCLPVPEGIDMVQAAGLPEAVFTVWMALFDQARLAPGETVLVHGGGSGIGTTAIQMARAAGARVFATAGGAAKCARCVELGAELAIDHQTQDFGQVLGEKLGPASVDVILDIVGAPYLARNLELLAIEGRLCYLAGDGGRVLQLDMAQLLKKRLHITGGSLRRRPIAEKARLAATIEHRVWPWVKSGAVRPQIGLTVPLKEAAKAHEALQQRKVTGKVILVTEAGGR
jgi:putative PIG3 family NAD(P)H quinone oxidoreductase